MEVGTSNTSQVPYGGKYGDYETVAYRGGTTKAKK